MKTTTVKNTAYAMFALTCFTLSPIAQAVVPAPDGGYPGGNTAEGDNALHDVNTAVGINNTAVGANALTHDTTGYSNVAVGEAALANNTTGNFNMAIGTEALRDNNANFNLAIGFRVGFMNTTGSHLTGIGAAALRNNTTGSDNTAIGADALGNNTTGDENTATGAGALLSNTTGVQNTANGFLALFSNTTGYLNTATGDEALRNNTVGYYNTANGYHALYHNIDGDENTAVGLDALFSNDHGIENTALGRAALEYNTGDHNTAVGFQALTTSTGSNNVALGANAGSALTTGSNNIDIGHNVNGVTGESNTIRIGNTEITDTFIRGISGATASGGAAVFVNGNGKLGTMTSSKRFKDQIKPMDRASEAILALRPVSFRYKKEIDPQGIRQFGLVAEEVEKVNPDLVARDADGKPYTVRYEAVNAMLLNEFLKAHRKVEKQEATIAELKKAMATLIAGVKEHDSEMQEVRTQLELQKPPARRIVNNQR